MKKAMGNLSAIHRQGRLLHFGALAVLLTAAGCTLPSRRVSRAAMMEMDIAALEKEIEGISSRLAALEESDREARATARREMTRLQSEHARTLQELESRIRQLEKLVAELSRQRARDREEIINTLSRSMEKAIRRYCRSGGSPAHHLSAEGYEHVVRPGETLSEIAKAYGVTVQAVVDANDIPDADRLRVGQKLFIPQ